MLSAQTYFNEWLFAWIKQKILKRSRERSINKRCDLAVAAFVKELSAKRKWNKGCVFGKYLVNEYVYCPNAHICRTLVILSLSQLKRTLNNHPLVSIDEIKARSWKKWKLFKDRVLEVLRGLEKRWLKCVISNEDYLGANNIDGDE